MLLAVSPVAIAAGPSDPATAPAAEPPADFSVPPPLVPADSEGAAEATANYSDGEISIDYPVTWEVAIDEAGDLVIANVPTTPANLVETQLFRIASPPGPLVNANIDSFIEEGSAVSRYRSVTIDEQSALVMWLADRPDELSSAIATFIGYGDNTIMLFSRYNPENADAEADILRLHSSLTNLTAAAADVEEAVPETAEGSLEDAAEIEDSAEDSIETEETTNDDL